MYKGVEKVEKVKEHSVVREKSILKVELSFKGGGGLSRYKWEGEKKRWWRG